MITLRGISRRTILGSASLAAFTGLSSRTHGQSTYPNRTIRLVIPFAPGGLFDTVGRPLAEKMKQSLGPIMVDNIGGNASIRGADVVAKAKPDGYTLLFAGNSSHVVAPLAVARMPYNPIEDFEPIGLVGTAGLAYAIHPSHEAKTFDDFIKYARANPGKIAIGNSGNGSLTHLTGALLAKAAELKDVTHVPYTGGGPLLSNLLGGHIPLAVLTLTGQNVKLHLNGQIRLLAVTSATREAMLPDVPTAAETIPDLVSLQFAGLFAPKGTPADIIARVQSSLSLAMADPGLRKLLALGAFEMRGVASSDELRKFLSTELARWKPVVEAEGFKIAPH